MKAAKRDLARELAREHYAAGDPLGWFEALYARAAGDFDVIPWADRSVNPHLADWCRREELPRPGTRVLVTGCGLGDDAEHLAARRAEVTAIDLSATAIEWCRQRFPVSPVRYCPADLLTFEGSFDLVVEIYTLQAMPQDFRRPAICALGRLASELLVICRGRDDLDPPGELPWPLTLSDFSPLESLRFSLKQFEDFDDPYEPGKRRFRMHWHKGL